MPFGSQQMGAQGLHLGGPQRDALCFRLQST